MKRFGKWNYEKDGTGYDKDENGMLKKMDSLVESVYNSEKNLEWLQDCGKPDQDPHPSEESDRDYDLFGSDEEDDAASPSKRDLGKSTPNKKPAEEKENKNQDRTPQQNDIKFDQSVMSAGTPNISAGGSIFIQDSIQVSQT